MKKRLVIKNTTTNYPISLTVIIYLLLDKFNATEWVWGSAGVIVFILWLIIIIDKCNSKSIDLFNDAINDKIINPKIKKSFKELMGELKEQNK